MILKIGERVNWTDISEEGLRFYFTTDYISGPDGKPVYTKDDVVLQAYMEIDGYHVDSLTDTYRGSPGRYGVSIGTPKKISYAVECFK